MLKELVTDEVIEPEVSGIFRASQVGQCEAFLCHQRLGHAALPLPGRVKNVLKDGRMHERDVVTQLINKGIEVKHSCLDGQIEVCCFRDPYVLGHPDGIMRVPESLVLDMSKGFALDYADETFKPGRFCLLEITAPEHFTFLRLQKSHLREILYVKYVQVQMYLNSPEVRSYGNCAVVEVKNKNTSALYEEGVSLDGQVVEYEITKLRRVEGLTTSGKVSEFRCDDWRRSRCRYRQLCFGEEELTPISLVTLGILKGETLKEAETLKSVADVWRRGKEMKDEGDGMVQDSREQFREVIEDYGCKGLTIDDVRAMMVDSTTKSCDYELLKQKYPDVYNEVVSSKKSRYVRVT